MYKTIYSKDGEISIEVTTHTDTFMSYDGMLNNCIAGYSYRYIFNNYSIFIPNVEKHFLEYLQPTKNELILYQLQANMNEQETEAFEKVFTKILKG